MDQITQMAIRHYHSEPTPENYLRLTAAALRGGSSAAELLGPAMEDRVLLEAERIMQVDRDLHNWQQQLSGTHDITYVRFSQDPAYLGPTYGVRIEMHQREPTEGYDAYAGEYVTHRNDFAIQIFCQFPFGEPDAEYRDFQLSNAHKWLPFQRMPHLRLSSQHLLSEADQDAIGDTNWRPIYSARVFDRERKLMRLFCSELRLRFGVHCPSNTPGASPFVHPSRW